MLKLREVRKEDWEVIVKLASKHNFPFPDFKNLLTSVVAVNENDEIMSFAMTKKFVEAVFIPDLDAPKRVIVEALKLTHDKMVEDGKQMELTQIHINSWHPSFTNILAKHFNMNYVRGSVMVKEL